MFCSVFQVKLISEFQRLSKKILIEQKKNIFYDFCQEIILILKDYPIKYCFSRFKYLFWQEEMTVPTQEKVKIVFEDEPQWFKPFQLEIN